MLGLAGAAFQVDPMGALYWPMERLLVIADLHFEKGSAYARRRVFLPPYDTAATLAMLAEVMCRYAPRRVVALGDSFHDAFASERLSARDRAGLRALQAGRDWVWIAGNHDPCVPAGLEGELVDELAMSGISFRHAPSAKAKGPEIAGHLHPVARVAGSAGSVRRRCFVSDSFRCILPAFGAYAGGLNMRDEAFGAIFGKGERFAHVLGRERIFTVSARQCLPD